MKLKKMKYQRRKRVILEKSEKLSRIKEICESYYAEGKQVNAIVCQTGLSRSVVYRIISKFASDNPEIADQMKKSGKDVTPKDYEALKKEVSRLQSALSREKLRADFYEEMVAYGKEVLGIDLKKGGTR